ncbi:DNA glycosylase [Flammula alnicola]|nr:DNA glycosylase [Flammula alnicola]
MSATKRTASTRVTRLTSRASEFNTQVTLFEAADLVEESPRLSKRVKTEVKAETIADLEDLKVTPGSTPTKTSRPTEPSNAIASGSSTPLKRDVKSPKKVKAVPQTLDKPHPAPPNWRETYDTIKQMRSRFVAPVDTMGCQQAQVEETDPKNRRYATLVALMLSSQTKDEVMNAAVSNLRKAFGGSISVEGMIAADDSVISQAIAKVGFWNKKTQYLKQTAIRLRDNFDSDVPKTVDQLCSLPGVDRRWPFLHSKLRGMTDGIGVDVHVHRITNLLGWHKPPTKQPEQTRLNLQSWLPKELYGDINHMLVGYGQVICLPVSPRCDVCDLSTKGMCPSARKVDSKNRKAIVFTSVQESPAKVEIALEGEVEEKKFSPNS